MTEPVQSKEHVIIGTAGHIDHGKTALVKALTGIDADTLAEEKRRGITIELGFVFLETPESEKQVVFIDVPGHEKLVRTMVAGASNIDAALLVIAADEGINVQTQEHFDILQLLGIKQGIIALTKSDLVDNSQIQALQSEIKSFVQGTFLEEAPVLPVSAITGAGIPELRAILVEKAEKVKSRHDIGVFRMPVDRVFTMSGFGTVVAGTVLSGEVKIGDRVEIYPEGLSSRVRGIQVHHSKTELSRIGKRTAINLPEIKKEKLRRGQCAATPGTLFPTNRLDGKLNLLKSHNKDLKNRARARLHVGTEEVICRIMFLDKDILKPGQSAFAQLVLETPTVALKGDRFVIRSFSPVMTIGGGEILDAFPKKKKRYDESALEGLKRLGGDIFSSVEQMFLKSGFIPLTIADVAIQIGESQPVIQDAVEKTLDQGKLIRVLSDKYLHWDSFNQLQEIVLNKLKDFFKANPYVKLMPISDLRAQVKALTNTEVFNQVLDNLVQAKKIFRKDSKLGLSGYELKLSAREQELAAKIENEYLTAGYKTPLENDIQAKLEMSEKAFQNVMNSLLAQERLIRLDDKVIYPQQTLEKIREIVIEYIRKNQSITMAELRDALDFSRKYAQPILEYFDAIGLTKRIGDKRVLMD